jgi:HPt (histidine-containing phosphotransfer) domain-containing protein
LELLAVPPKEETMTAFITQVHALKSASASIGAAEVSRHAASLEALGRDGDIDKITSELPKFYACLSGIVAQIKEVISKYLEYNGESQSIDRDVLSSLKDAVTAEDVGKADRIIASLSESADLRTGELLSKISDLLLMSDFREAEAEIDAMMTNEDIIERTVVKLS